MGMDIDWETSLFGVWIHCIRYSYVKQHSHEVDNVTRDMKSGYYFLKLHTFPLSHRIPYVYIRRHHCPSWVASLVIFIDLDPVIDPKLTEH